MHLVEVARLQSADRSVSAKKINGAQTNTHACLHGVLVLQHVHIFAVARGAFFPKRKCW